ncbi:MAG: hypothetical protein QNJ60_15385 [Xenococcaceae cyanobacterium MO_188.B19]|nr:hypothetical protein [Xenococcaceae cyanobacterium MO_188.B19]
MYSNNSTQVSSLDRALGISLAMFSMFVVGYTASRVFLSQGTNQTVIESTVIPHQAAMWSDLGR